MRAFLAGALAVVSVDALVVAGWGWVLVAAAAVMASLLVVTGVGRWLAGTKGER